jgi:cation transport ATPase
VTSFDAAPGWDYRDVARLAAAAEGHLPHPMARAIRRYARSEHLELPEPESVRVAPGGGVEANIAAHRVQVGRRDYLEASGVVLPPPLPTEASVAHVAVDGCHAASIRMQDGVRHEARGVVGELRALGVSSLWLATGDGHAVATRVASSLQLDGVRARMLPEDKVRLVRELRDGGHTVAVVGDGINDAAAMAEANVGVAVARGADLARESAEVVLGREDLSTLVDALQLARFTMRVVREDIALVAVPNTVALAAATLGAVSPLAATLVNNGSTMLTGLNSLRPLTYTPAPARNPSSP